MPVYEYKCSDGHRMVHSKRFDPADIDLACPVMVDRTLCQQPLKRVFSFSFHRPMGEHFNHSVGKYVSNKRQFSDELKKRSEADSERLGMPVNYQPVDLHDAGSLGVESDALERPSGNLWL